MTTDAGAGRPYDVSGYPTLKFFGEDKAKPTSYESGERTYDKFVEYLVK
jgi:protein disulfide-isomerase A6